MTLQPAIIAAPRSRCLVLLQLFLDVGLKLGILKPFVLEELLVLSSIDFEDGLPGSGLLLSFFLWRWHLRICPCRF